MASVTFLILPFYFIFCSLVSVSPHILFKVVSCVYRVIWWYSIDLYSKIFFVLFSITFSSFPILPINPRIVQIAFSLFYHSLAPLPCTADLLIYRCFPFSDIFEREKRGCEKTRLSFFTSPKNVRKLPLVYQKFLYCFFSKFLLFYCPLFSFFIHVANFIYNWIKRCDFHISSE